MTDEEKYAPENITVDVALTERTIDEWNDEARRRAREDAYVKLTGKRFCGIRPDPNAAFIVGVMQKHFMNLAADPSAKVRLFPRLNEAAPRVLGIISVDEEHLGETARDAITVLEHICDDTCRKTEEPDEDGVVRTRIRFTLTDVWASYETKGNAYDEWLWLTYG